MLFRRRIPLTFGQKCRQILWPRMGLRRLVTYYKYRILRLPGTPEQIAGGLALGVAVSFTPFVGFHMLIGAGLCWLTGFSVVAMLLGTVIAGNPWTFSIIWVSSYKLGQAVLSHPSTGGAPADFTFQDLMQKPLDLLLPMSIGCIPFLVVFGALAYYLGKRLVVRYRALKLDKIVEHMS